MFYFLRLIAKKNRQNISFCSFQTFCRLLSKNFTLISTPEALKMNENERSVQQLCKKIILFFSPHQTWWGCKDFAAQPLWLRSKSQILFIFVYFLRNVQGLSQAILDTHPRTQWNDDKKNLEKKIKVLDFSKKLRKRILFLSSSILCVKRVAIVRTLYFKDYETYQNNNLLMLILRICMFIYQSITI